MTTKTGQMRERGACPTLGYAAPARTAAMSTAGRLVKLVMARLLGGLGLGGEFGPALLPGIWVKLLSRHR